MKIQLKIFSATVENSNYFFMWDPVITYDLMKRHPTIPWMKKTFEGISIYPDQIKNRKIAYDDATLNFYIPKEDLIL